MTEEIIIDGVDVSKVSFDKNNGLHICCCDDIRDEKTPFMLFCSNNPNCNFKQLKRAEQKLKTIESVATDLLSLTNEFDNCYHKDECKKCDRVCQYRFVDKILQIIEGEENV